MSDPIYTYKYLLDLDFFDSYDEITDITNFSYKENQLNNQIEKISKFWDD